MNPVDQFAQERRDRLAGYAQDTAFQTLSRDWLQASMQRQYVYNFDWMGRPIIQYPQDMVAMQELVWRVRPDLIIETGIAHGGSLVLSASLLALLDMSDAIEAGTTLDPRASRRKVLGVDIDIRAHNRAAIEAHPMASRIAMIQGSAVAPEVVQQVHAFAQGYQRVLVCLDSMHTHDQCWVNSMPTRRWSRPAAIAWCLTPSWRTCHPSSLPTAPGTWATTPRRRCTSGWPGTPSSRSTPRWSSACRSRWRHMGFCGARGDGYKKYG